MQYLNYCRYRYNYTLINKKKLFKDASTTDGHFIGIFNIYQRYIFMTSLDIKYTVMAAIVILITLIVSTNS